MNWLDIVLLLSIATSVITGWMSGFARVAIGFAATIVAFVVASWFYGQVGGLIYPLIHHQLLANVMGFVLLFLLVIVAGGAVSRVVRTIFRFTGLSIVDRLAGAAFGLVRGLLAAVVLLTVLLSFAPAKLSESVSESKAAPYVLTASEAISNATPHELKEGFQVGYREVQSALKQALQRHPRKQKRPVEE